MSRQRRKTRRASVHPVAASPGSIDLSTASASKNIEVFAWDSQRLVEGHTTTLPEALALRDGLPLLWINIDGTPSGTLLNELGLAFGIHPLALEDVQHPTQRAKVEPFGSVLFVVVPIPTIADGEFQSEQLAMFIGSNFVLTIQERDDGDCLDSLRRRIRSHQGRIRDKASPYLAFAIIDAVIDHYFPIVNDIGSRVDAIEEDVVDTRTPPDMYAIRHAKHDLAKVRQAIWPMRDALTAMMTMESWFDLEHRLFLRNALDHVMRLIDMLDADRTMASELMELTIGIANAKLGEVTKVLTMIATIFIPITFVAGVYGMNFDEMPELHWKYGYFVALGVMAIITVSFLTMFWRHGWFKPTMLSPRADRQKPAKD